jgi:cell division protein FtsL
MKSRKSLAGCYLGCAVLIFGGILAYLAYHIHVVRMGYEMSQMQKEKRELERLHSELLIEISSLSSLDRIEKIAAVQLGMIPGDSSGKIRVTELEGNTGSSALELAERETPRSLIK